MNPVNYSIREYGDFKPGLEKTWDDLLVQAGTAPAQMSWTWRRLWWAHFGRGRLAKIVVAKTPDEIVSILPLYKRWGLEYGLPLLTLNFIGGSLSDYNQPLLQRGAEAALCAIFSHLKNDHTWTLIDLFNLNEASLALCKNAAREAGLASESSPLVGCRYLTLSGSFDSYWSGLSRNTRHELNKRENRLRRCGQLQFAAIMDPQEMEELLAAAAQLNRARWRKAADNTSIFENAEIEAFFREMALALAAKGETVLFSLSMKGELIAYHFGHVFQGVFSSWNAGWDPAYAEFSPGRVLEKLLLQWCHEQKLHKVDFMRGDYRYKASWTEQMAWNHRLLLARNRGIVKAALFMLTKLKPWTNQKLGFLYHPVSKIKRKRYA